MSRVILLCICEYNHENNNAMFTIMRATLGIKLCSCGVCGPSRSRSFHGRSQSECHFPALCHSQVPSRLENRMFPYTSCCRCDCCCRCLVCCLTLPYSQTVLLIRIHRYFHVATFHEAGFYAFLSVTPVTSHQGRTPATATFT